MADEITISTSLLLSKGEIKNRQVSASGKKFDQTGTGYSSGTVVVEGSGGAWNAIDLSQLTTPGKIHIVNTGAEDVQLAVDDGAGNKIPFCELEPGQPHMGGWVGNDIYHRSATVDPSEIEWFITEA